MFLRTGFLFFSVQILTIFLRKRQLHRKFNHILRAPCLYRTAVQLHYLPGNGQAQPNTAAVRKPELLKWITQDISCTRRFINDRKS